MSKPAVSSDCIQAMKARRKWAAKAVMMPMKKLSTSRNCCCERCFSLQAMNACRTLPLRFSVATLSIAVVL